MPTRYSSTSHTYIYAYIHLCIYTYITYIHHLHIFIHTSPTYIHTYITYIHHLHTSPTCIHSYSYDSLPLSTPTLWSRFTSPTRSSWTSCSYSSLWFLFFSLPACSLWFPFCIFYVVFFYVLCSSHDKSHTYIHIYIHTYTHTYINTYIHTAPKWTEKPAYMFACTCVRGTTAATAATSAQEQLPEAQQQPPEPP